jgi:hypothetical protein
MAEVSPAIAQQANRMDKHFFIGYIQPAAAPGVPFQV